MKLIKVICGALGSLLVGGSIVAVLSDSARLNAASTVIALSGQTLLMAALVVHLREKRKTQ